MIHLSGNYLNTFYQRQRPINSSYRPHLSPSALLRGGSAPFPLPLQGRTPAPENTIFWSAVPRHRFGKRRLVAALQ